MKRITLLYTERIHFSFLFKFMIRTAFMVVLMKGQMSVWTLPDLSAAFDTLDHSILLARLHDMIGISGKANEWFSSYLSDGVQAVSVNGLVSSQKCQWSGLFIKVSMVGSLHKSVNGRVSSQMCQWSGLFTNVSMVWPLHKSVNGLVSS